MKVKITTGLGLYPLIFVIIFIKRYSAGMDISSVHNWIGIAITSFFWWIGVTVALIIIFFLIAVVAIIKK